MLAGYADGELSPVEHEAIAAHLETCGRCRQTVLDQQRIQHVFAQCPVPEVSEDEWNAMAQRLRAELEGKAEPVVLKTRPMLEDLQPTPPPAPAVTEEPAQEAAEAPSAPSPAPAPEQPPPPAPERPPAPTRILGAPRPRRRRARWRWVAHVVGAAAAAAVVLLSISTHWLDRAPPLEPESLARQDDVDIIELECDPGCSVVLQTGEAHDVFAVWVEPEEPNG